jgi:hypothetical protein
MKLVIRRFELPVEQVGVCTERLSKSSRGKEHGNRRGKA